MFLRLCDVAAVSKNCDASESKNQVTHRSYLESNVVPVRCRNELRQDVKDFCDWKLTEKRELFKKSHLKLHFQPFFVI